MQSRQDVNAEFLLSGNDFAAQVSQTEFAGIPLRCYAVGVNAVRNK